MYIQIYTHIHIYLYYAALVDESRPLEPSSGDVNT